MNRHRLQKLKWKERPPSLKKDYRPAEFAGTKKRLAYLQRNRDSRIAARKMNISDFVSSWISRKSVVPAFVEARSWLDQSVEKRGKDTLLSCETAKSFISKIGGKPRSFNHRESWVKKVNTILDRAGLCSLAAEMGGGASFEVAWGTQGSGSSSERVDEGWSSKLLQWLGF